MTESVVTAMSPLEVLIAVVRNGIVSGSVPPGTFLDPAEIGNEYRVDANLARRALDALSQEGALGPPRTGYRVPAAPARPSAITFPREQAGLTRLTLYLTADAKDALEAAASVTGDSKTDTVNRAIRVYRWLADVFSSPGPPS